jgi:hypothetical protein
MARYSDYELSKLLDGYWDLCERIVPLDGNIVREYASPYEAAVCLKADIDLAIDMLSPGRWTGIIKSFPEFSRSCSRIVEAHIQAIIQKQANVYTIC